MKTQLFRILFLISPFCFAGKTVFGLEGLSLLIFMMIPSALIGIVLFFISLNYSLKRQKNRIKLNILTGCSLFFTAIPFYCGVRPKTTLVVLASIIYIINFLILYNNNKSLWKKKTKL